ncbi:MAG: biopolymer transporter ExbD [Labilithrix sp.]|nr:biopolymer transporter ExbD [Labilithrix sp.]MCW5813107.1 biopolymer transporter ExbD [Labilithrix sp.]
MTVARPGARLLRNVPLSFVARKLGGGQRPVTTSLSLTSMIDFLVVSVVFLLLTFQAPSECGCIGLDPRLPHASNVMEMIDAPMISVAGTRILVDGSAAGNTLAVDESKRVQRVDEVFDALVARRETWKQLHPNKPFPGNVVLRIDQDVSSAVVKSLFQTAARAGYPSVSFMVEHQRS